MSQYMLHVLHVLGRASIFNECEMNMHTCIAFSTQATFAETYHPLEEQIHF